MAITRINKGLSLYPEDIQRLAVLSMKTGMTESEIIRQLIKKAASDEKCIQIITSQSYWDNVHRREEKALMKEEMRPTSHNVQDEKSSKHHSKEEAVSTNCLLDYIGPDEARQLFKDACPGIPLNGYGNYIFFTWVRNGEGVRYWKWRYNK